MMNDIERSSGERHSNVWVVSPGHTNEIPDMRSCSIDRKDRFCPQGIRICIMCQAEKNQKRIYLFI